MSDNTLAEYRSKHLRPGSTFYYCVRSLSPTIRQTLESFFMLYRELASVAEHSREHAVARVRYDWWGEELQRWASHQARHPLTCAWPLEGAFQNTLPALLQETREQLSARLVPGYLSEHNNLVQYCHGTAGVFAYVAAQLEHSKHTPPRAIFNAFSVGVELTRLLKQLAPLRTQGLALAHSNPSDPMDPALTELLAFAQQQFVATQTQALAAKSNRIAYRIAKAQLNELTRNRAQLWTHQINLTPMRKFWISWTAPLYRR